MKKIKLFLTLFLLTTFSISNVSAHAEEFTQVDNMSEKEEELFKAENVVSTTAEEVMVDGEKVEFVLQEFSDTIPVITYSGESTYVTRKGLEILDKEVYDERQAKLNSRININDRYADGRGTYLYIEITYTKTPVSGTTFNNYNMTHIYCNSSGSTLTKYSITYGQSGFSSSFSPISQSNTVNINTVEKTFDRSLNWKPVIDYQGIVGATQTYTCRGWTNSWTFNII